MAAPINLHQLQRMIEHEFGIEYKFCHMYSAPLIYHKSWCLVSAFTQVYIWVVIDGIVKKKMVLAIRITLSEHDGESKNVVFTIRF